jgi:hypothetical protein
MYKDETEANHTDNTSLLDTKYIKMLNDKMLDTTSYISAKMKQRQIILIKF